MNLLKFTLLSLKGRALSTVFTIIAIALAVTLTFTVILVSTGIEEGVKKQAGAFDLVVGAEGSPTQLVLNSILFLDTPIANIPYSSYEELQKDERVLKVVPLALGDYFYGQPIVGTTTDYFLPFREGLPERFTLQQGEWFSKVGDAVLGSYVASAASMKIGDTFFGNHGIADDTHESLEYRVVGILEPTGTADDKAVFTKVDSVWAVHGHAANGEESYTDEEDSHVDGEESHSEEESHVTKSEHATEEEVHSDEEDSKSLQQESHSEEKDSHTEQEESHTDEEDAHPEQEKSHVGADDAHQWGDEHDEELQITALLVKPQSLGFVPSLKEELDNVSGVQAVYPVRIFRQVLSTFSYGQQIALILASSSIVLAALFILFTVLGSIVQRKEELAILKAIGVSRHKLLLQLLYEAAFITIMGIGVGFLIALGAFYFIQKVSASYAGILLPDVTITWEFLKYALYMLLGAMTVSILPALPNYLQRKG
ncbi:FtsX-like permease family protein [Bacillus sp. HMF5848]|uniref:ABC transporter permease n=1 Tax=Bacillus sp. HMF5848 TaxID=2495421 RepID=UPI000F776C69|nr:ABC transporter permease [Bacillus sp. HMF5848]RSK28706.1 FtsX-like permease family protein [Bacillus sp. HMF5848]